MPRPLHGLLHAIGKLWQPVGRRMDDAFGAVAGVLPGGRAALWMILAALVLFAVAALTARSTRRVLRATADGAGPQGAAQRGAAALEREAVEAERAGRLQEAVRLRFQAGLMRLAEHDLIDGAASTPNAQLRRELHSPRFDALARRFDEIVYGGDEAREQDVQDAGGSGRGSSGASGERAAALPGAARERPAGRRGWAVAGAVVVVVVVALELLGSFFGPGPQGPVSSSYATDAQGLAAWSELASRAGHPVAALREPLSGAALDPASTLVVLDPDALLRNDGRNLLVFVRRGGRLILGGQDPTRR